MIKLLERPEFCPGGYSLHLYCKYENPDHGHREFPHEITEFGNHTASVRAARRTGWLVHKDNTATCPKCARWLQENKADRGSGSTSAPLGDSGRDKS